MQGMLRSEGASPMLPSYVSLGAPLYLGYHSHQYQSFFKSPVLCVPGSCD